MDDKRNSLLTIGLVCAVLLVLGVADLWNSDRVYSEAAICWGSNTRLRPSELGIRLVKAKRWMR